MKLDELTSTKQIQNELKSVQVKIGVFGGRKFSLGESKDRFTMNQLIAKIQAIAIQENGNNTLSYETLQNIQEELKSINHQGDLAIVQEGKIKTGIMKARRWFRQTEVANRFQSFKNLCQSLAQKEIQALHDCKAEFLDILKGRKELDDPESKLPAFLCEELRPHLEALRRQDPPVDIPENPNEKQLLDIWNRAINGRSLDFSKQTRSLMSILTPLSLRLFGDGDVLRTKFTEKLDTRTLTNIERTRIYFERNPNLKVFDSNKETVVENFINYLLEAPPNLNDESLNGWFSQDKLFGTPSGESSSTVMSG